MILVYLNSFELSSNLNYFWTFLNSIRNINSVYLNPFELSSNLFFCFLWKLAHKIIFRSVRIRFFQNGVRENTDRAYFGDILVYFWLPGLPPRQASWTEKSYRGETWSELTVILNSFQLDSKLNISEHFSNSLSRTSKRNFNVLELVCTYSNPSSAWAHLNLTQSSMSMQYRGCPLMCCTLPPGGPPLMRHTPQGSSNAVYNYSAAISAGFVHSRCDSIFWSAIPLPWKRDSCTEVAK